MPARVSIHGVVLSGGRGLRMGGVDKGLQLYGGRALVLRAAERLAAQVGSLSISANRHLDVYGRFGWPVWPDDVATERGPLDGLATALGRASLPWLAAVPCDSPHLPSTLVARLAAAVDAQDADAACAVTTDADGARRLHPVVCLMRTSLHQDLCQALDAGERRVGAWLRRQRFIEVAFDDAEAFANFNTLGDLEAHHAAVAAAGVH